MGMFLPGKIIWGLFVCIGLVVWTGCAQKIPDPGQRLSLARQLAGAHSHVEESQFEAGKFKLFAFQSLKEESPSKNIHIYIEGDGLAWITSSRPSDNPTPITPVGLKLFLKDPAPWKIYLARPCQYVIAGACRQKYWTSHRFSKEIIDAFHGVLDRIKTEYTPEGFTLFGYSGGGAVAALLAAQRDDVSGLVTIAGNLDTDFWTQLHGLTPLTGSLNPADFTPGLEQVPQHHFMGSWDRIIPPSVFISFQNQFTHKGNIDHKILNDFDHACCWDRRWRSILNTLD